jgi:hypothetical protein
MKNIFLFPDNDEYPNFYSKAGNNLLNLRVIVGKIVRLNSDLSKLSKLYGKFYTLSIKSDSTTKEQLKKYIK